jgi:prepilin-type N-terminal cleavage/methylation domain
MSGQAMMDHDVLKAGSRQRGFTLIELMVAMLLGLIVIGGVTSVFLANQQVYRSNQALGDVEDGSRTAFDLMATDVRQAGLTGCGTTRKIANVLNDGPYAGGTVAWFANWNNSLHGYGQSQTDPALSSLTGTGARAPSSATAADTSDSLELIGTNALPVSVKSDVQPGDTIHLSGASGLSAGDIIMVCDPNRAAIVQVTSIPASAGSVADVAHDIGTGGISPGNCSDGLGYLTACDGGNGNANPFPFNAQVGTLTAVDWYIGLNPAASSGRSLYRVRLQNVGGTASATTPEEMVRNVTGMRIRYHVANAASLVAASAVTNWNNVDAVQVTFWLQSSNQRAGVNATPIQRSYAFTATVRNRVN